jgi:hypothetical protein
MSQPNIPNITPIISLTRDESINLILSSIAMQELGLSHIMNAEAEKIKYVIGTLSKTGANPPPTLEEINKINCSVRDVLKEVVRTEMVLQSKMDSLKDFASIQGCSVCVPPSFPNITNSDPPNDPLSDPSNSDPSSTNRTSVINPIFNSTINPVISPVNNHQVESKTEPIIMKKIKRIKHWTRNKKKFKKAPSLKCKKKLICKCKKQNPLQKSCKMIKTDKKIVRKTSTLIKCKQKITSRKLKRPSRLCRQRRASCKRKVRTNKYKLAL